MRREMLELVREHALRHAHMIGVTRKTMSTAFAVDPSRVLDATRAVRQRLRRDSVLHLKTAAGGNLEVILGPRSIWNAHEGVIRPGRWENLPSGELTTSPSSVNGVFVADASLGGQVGAAAGLLSRTPIRVQIEDGFCKAVECDSRTLQHAVVDFLAREPYLNRVGTITLGTNIGLHEPTGEQVCDQSLPGLHVTFGSVMPELTGGSFETRAQLAMTCAEADIDLDGAPLLRRGRYLLG
jgi:leucyl aminopeptidase (aminopeptidase T)